MTAVPASDFLNSIGANSAIAARRESLQKTIECADYLGLRWFRAGVEGNVPVAQFIKLLWYQNKNFREHFFGWYLTLMSQRQKIELH